MPAERKKSNNGGGADSRIFMAESVESRTPLAWQQRNINYHQQQNNGTLMHTTERQTNKIHSSQQNGNHSSEGQQQAVQGRRSSSITASSSSSSTERASKNSRPVNSAPPVAYPAYVGTWDGEPCPVHHLQMLQVPPSLPIPQHLSVQGIPPAMLPPSIAATLPRRPPAYEKNMLMLLPPMLQPRPLVVPASEGPLEPLPVRDPKGIHHTLPRKEGSAASEKSVMANTGKNNNCQGHTVVLWFIITVITIGVLLGAVLRFVMA
ncbi:uncharacterized protein LOC132192399 [Neocloeon triangulifer]|uniref:uncharacterized protein LOC132192399 n=1 Tax=Neocloeon triangulifer TaxID=2078957 RepID=UPI00286EB99A|nr:uncharacterized protein LOC132192399 [Neocloeon triangulifer]